MDFSRDWRLALGATAAVLAGGGRAAAQHMWTVDDNGPADFTTIQDAVNACANGDVVRVFAGTYAGFQIAGKGVAVLGDSATPRHLTSVVSVTSTSAGQTRGLGFTQSTSVHGAVAGITISGCAGIRARVQDCSMERQLRIPRARRSRASKLDRRDAQQLRLHGGHGAHTSLSKGRVPRRRPWHRTLRRRPLWGVNATSGLPDTSTTGRLQPLRRREAAEPFSTAASSSRAARCSRAGRWQALAEPVVLCSAMAPVPWRCGRWGCVSSSGLECVRATTNIAAGASTTNCSGWYVNGPGPADRQPFARFSHARCRHRARRCAGIRERDVGGAADATGAPGGSAYAVAKLRPISTTTLRSTRVELVVPAAGAGASDAVEFRRGQFPSRSRPCRRRRTSSSTSCRCTSSTRTPSAREYAARGDTRPLT